MKQRPAIKGEEMNDRNVFHTLLFLCLSFGLFFGAQANQFEIGNDGFQFLNGTEISSEHTTISDPSTPESATVESEEKEEKEERETESDSDGTDALYGTRCSDLTPPNLGDSFIPFSSLFEPYSKRKLYILFHCLKSDLA